MVLGRTTLRTLTLGDTGSSTPTGLITSQLSSDTISQATAGEGESSSTMAYNEAFIHRDYDNAGKSNVLRRGMFIFEQTDSKGKTMGDFIFVPEGYDFTTHDGMTTLFKALEIDKPNFVFNFQSNHGIVPRGTKEKTLKDWYITDGDETPISSHTGLGKVKPDAGPGIFVEIPEEDLHIDQVERLKNELWTERVLESIPPDGVLFLISKPYGGNVLSRLACEAAQKNDIPSLALLTCDEDHHGSNMMTTILDDDLLAESELLAPSDDQHIARLNKFGCDQRRVKIPKAVFLDRQNCRPIGDEVSHAIPFMGDYTKDEIEQYLQRDNKYLPNIPGILADECSHRLVFESEESLEAFKEHFASILPTGYWAAGDSRSEMEVAFNALRDGSSLFVLDGTGPVADVVKHFKNKNKKPLENKEPFTTTRFYSRDLDAEKQSLVLAITLLEKGEILANYNSREACCVIEQGSDGRSIQSTQKQITKIMSVTVDHNFEISGQDADIRAVETCMKLETLLENSMTRYYFYGMLVHAIILITYFASMFITSLFPPAEGDLTVGGVITVVTTFILTVFRSFDTTMNPLTKYANLLLTHAKLQSERFRFRTGTGVYCYSNISEDGHDTDKPRDKFMTKCSEIFTECMSTEVKEGFLSNYFCRRRKYVLEEHKFTRAALSSPSNNNNSTNEIDADEEARPSTLLTQSLYQDLMMDIAQTPQGCNANELKSEELEFRGPGSLSLEVYIKFRLKAKTHEFKELNASFANWRNFLQFLVLAFTAANTILTPFKIEQWIPVMLAIGTVLRDVISLVQLDTRPSSFNEAYRGLTSAQTLTDKFSIATRRLPANKEEIVDRTEIAILSSFERIATHTLSFAKSKDRIFKAEGQKLKKQKTGTGSSKKSKKMKL